MSRTIAVGDVHGCSKALKALIDAVSPTRHDTLIVLGDYIDRGPDSRQVIDQLIELQAACQLISLIGNHERMLLSVLADEMDGGFWEMYGGAQTLDSYGGDLESIPASHREFLANCRPFFETDTHFFVHANYIATLDLDEQPEHVLLWEHVSSTVPPPHKSGKTAVVGHTPQIEGEILDLGHLVCIDTCCFAGGWLTAYEPGTGSIWQADVLGTVRS